MSDGGQPIAQTTALIKRKALGFIEGIRKMGAAEQMKTIGLATANDFDRLIDLFAGAVPQLQTLAPPRTTQFEGRTQRHARETYAEILIRAEQIYHILDGLEEDPGT